VENIERGREMKRINKKLVGAMLGLVLLFAAVGTASAQSFGPRGYYHRFGYWHPYVYSVRPYDRDDYYWHHRDRDDYRWRWRHRDRDDWGRRDWDDHHRRDWDDHRRR
jgi:hypothetical protein